MTRDPEIILKPVQDRVTFPFGNVSPKGLRFVKDMQRALFALQQYASPVEPVPNVFGIT